MEPSTAGTLQQGGPGCLGKIIDKRGLAPENSPLQNSIAIKVTFHCSQSKLHAIKVKNEK